MQPPITALPPAIDPNATVATLDDLTKIIRSLHQPQRNDQSYVDYSHYVDSLRIQQIALRDLHALYANANRWVQMLNAVSWNPVVLGYVEALIKQRATAPTEYIIEANEIILIWTLNTENESIGIHLRIQNNGHVQYGDWAFVNYRKMLGFSYKEFTYSMFHEYFHDMFDESELLKIVMAMHPDNRKV